MVFADQADIDAALMMALVAVAAGRGPVAVGNTGRGAEDSEECSG